MKNSLDIQAWRNKYIYQIKESEDDEWDLNVNPWSDFSDDFQELVNLVGLEIANRLAKDLKDKVNSPKDALNYMYIVGEYPDGYKDVWINFFEKIINDKDEDEVDFETAIGMADMMTNDIADKETGVALAKDILNKEFKFKEGENSIDVANRLWTKMNKIDDNRYENMDTDPRGELGEYIQDLLYDYIKLKGFDYKGPYPEEIIVKK